MKEAFDMYVVTPVLVIGGIVLGAILVVGAGIGLMLAAEAIVRSL